MMVFSHYGFASVSTDTGHLSMDGAWALNHPESIIDWGWRAMHGTVELAKQIVTTYYSDDIQYSYYAGCSTGGRQGLKEIQRFPNDFDGVLAGAPAWWTNHLQTWTTWIAQQNLPESEPKHINADQYAAIVKEVKAQCDPQDGVTDSIMQNPGACNFNYDSLLCSSENANTSTCLTPTQLDTIQKLYHPYIEDGNFVFPGFALGADPSLLTLAPASLGYGFLQWFVYNDTSYSYQNFSYADVQAADRVNPGDATADDFDISAFKNKGGKLIMYHGWEDMAIPTGSTPYYYEATKKAMPASNLDDFYRLFLIPGMGHCAGSMVAPWYIGGASQNRGVKNVTYSVPGYMDTEHDAVLALMRWVEEGKAPEHIVATKFDNDTAPAVVRQRALCVYPKVAQYKGSGDVDEASNWVC